jgi:hypothetical protein
MAGISRSTNQDRLFGTRPERCTLPAILPSRLAHQEQAEAASLILTEADPLPPSRRLVVILPDADLDVFALSKRLWNLAAPERRQVLLLTRPGEAENEYHSRVSLTTLASLIRDARVEVQTQVIAGLSLEKAARQYSRSDDVLVCFEEQRNPGFLKQDRLADVLAQKTHLPVYTLKGSVSEMTHHLSESLIEFALLAICLAVLLGFFALELWIDRNTAGAFHTVLELLAVFAEVWIIAACAKGAFRI